MRFTEPTLKHPPQETTKGWIARLRAAGAELVKNGSPIGQYFMQIDDAAVATKRDTKDHLAYRLRASFEVPQVITVQARRGGNSCAYMIIPLDKVTETLESILPKEDGFVPITVRLREIGDGKALPILTPRVGRRRRKSVRSTLPAIASAVREH